MDFAPFRLSVAERMELLAAQTECTIGRLDADGWPSWNSFDGMRMRHR